MFYYLHGNDTKAVNDKANSLVADLLKKRPDASFFTLTDENWTENIIDEYTLSQGLFENKYIVLVKSVFSGDGSSAGDKKVRKEIFLDKVEQIAISPNVFIVAEGATDKVSLKKIEKHAQKVQEFGDEKVPATAKKGGDFKVFDLADALGSRDKKTLWTLYRQAMDAGKAPEEVHGILFWQVKNLMIAIRTNTAGESGLNPFVFSKAKAYSQNFSTTEISALMEELVSIYHDAHRGIHDFETAMEVFVLEKI